MSDVHSPIVNPVPNQPASNIDPNNWLNDAPGGDMTLDEIFGQQPTTDVAPAVQDGPTTPAPIQTQSWEPLKTATGTVYNTREEAIKGVEKKDALIEELRHRYIMERGVDPITNQPVAPSTPQGQPKSYLQNQSQYIKDLTAAAEKGDEIGYANVQAQFVYDLLQPIAPIITDFAKTKAVEQVSSEIGDFRAFRTSPDFQNVMNENRALRFAIETAEADFRSHEQLPELYRLAYKVAQGNKVPELLKQQADAARAAAAQAPRPTLAPVSHAPVRNGAQNVQPSLSTSEGRKALIAQFEAQGIRDRRF